MKAVYQKKENALNVKQGFTLVEMSIVVAIIGLVTAIAVPNFLSQMPTRNMNQAVWDLNSQIRLARTKAMSLGTDAIMTYDQHSRTITIWTDEDGDGLRDVNEQETLEISGKHGLQVYVYPYNPTGTFSPDGSFNVVGGYDSNHLFIYLRAIGSKTHYYLYVWPTGQVTVHKLLYQYEYS